jgi:hypothetical protein
MRSSSAAYRSIRQFEAKNGKTNAVVEKVGDKQFLRFIKSGEFNFETFSQLTPDVTYNGKTFKYFTDGSNGEGYYELKTGNRRRPNSQYFSVVDMYIIFHEKEKKQGKE